MLALLLALAAAGVLRQNDSGALPSFRSEAYVVAIQIPVFEGRKWCRGTKPITTLTTNNVAVGLDSQPFTNTTLVHDDKKPGHYTLSLVVPETARDGKTHRIDIKLRNGVRGSITYRTLIPKSSEVEPPRPVEDWISELCK
jgi:hypothetical protein